MKNIQEFQAGCIERAANTLAFYLECTQPEKRNWTPTIEGAASLRSALDMIGECILVNRAIAYTLRGEAMPGGPVGPQSPRPFNNPDEAGAMLRESAQFLANAVRNLSDVDLAREFPSRRGPMPGALLMEMPLRNMHYHAGQVNLLQLMYGDTEFRMPPVQTPRS